MKLYDAARVPNPRRVRVFIAEKGLAEKGVEIVREEVDLAGFAHRSADFTGVNPLQRVPALVLDDGTVICESLAICRYLEALHPDPPLFGADPVEIGLVTMWERRVEFGLMSAVAAVFRHGHPGMAAYEEPQVAAWADVNRPRIREALAFLDERCARSPFLVGERFSVADITALVSLDFMRVIKVGIPDELTALRSYHERLKARPSAAA